MKKLTVVLLLMTGCYRSEPYVNLVQESLPKTVTIHVNATRVGLELIDNKPVIKKHRLAVLGAGVFITSHGHILTCAHLFGFTQIDAISVCTYDGNCYGGELIAIDAHKDLAIVKIEAKFTDYAKLADPRSLVVGQEVIAIGSPLGLDFSVTHGILSQVNRDLHERYNVSQSDAAINPGNSGGPLFNMRGELIGINSFMITLSNSPTFTGLGFSVQPGQILEFLTKYRGL